MEKESQATSDKGQKLKNYSLKFKLDAISFAAIHEIMLQKRSKMLNEREYANGERKKKVLKKL